MTLSEGPSLSTEWRGIEGEDSEGRTPPLPQCPQTPPLETAVSTPFSASIFF
jgi:hypothetical protein